MMNKEIEMPAAGEKQWEKGIFFLLFLGFLGALLLFPACFHEFQHFREKDSGTGGDDGSAGDGGMDGSDAGYDSDAGLCASDAGCKPESSESQICGNCGLGREYRYCDHLCRWSDWSECTGNTGCKPDDTETCGTDGKRTCSAECVWGPCVHSCAGIVHLPIIKNGLAYQDRPQKSWNGQEDFLEARCLYTVVYRFFTAFDLSLIPYCVWNELKSVKKATLHYKCNSTWNPTRYLEIRRTKTTWVESVNWQTMPEPGDGTFIKFMQPQEASEWYELDVTKYIDQFVDGYRQYTGEVWTYFDEDINCADGMEESNFYIRNRVSEFKPFIEVEY